MAVRLKIPIWSKLSRLQRVLLGAVVVVVALFIASVSAGATQDPGDPAAHPDGIVGWLGDLVGGPPAVDRADLTGPCLVDDGKALQVDGSCVLTVAAGDESLRRITLRATDPVTVVAPVPRQDTTASSDLGAGDELAVDIDADGGDLTITCPSGGTCAVGLS